MEPRARDEGELARHAATYFSPVLRGKQETLGRLLLRLQHEHEFVREFGV